jgi:riboflavin kinase / FMN adenylyltransferase
MELIRGLHNLRARHHGCVATIGNFDGVHRGHQAVLERLQKQAQRMRLPATVMIFEPTPREFFTPDQAPARISSLREKLEDLAETGIQRVLCVRFDEQFAALSPQDFIGRVLVEGLGVKYLAIGDDFRFGHRRAGDFALLKASGDRLGFTVSNMEPYCLEGARISSTRVREALAAGDMQQATQLMGRPYRVCGRVETGQQLGRKLGVPTANLPLRMRRAIRYGVYAARVDTQRGKGLPAVVSVGVRPTVAVNDCLLEAHLLDFADNLYGQRINVHLMQFLRPERHFPNLDVLQEEMNKDIAKARAWLQENP